MENKAKEKGKAGRGWNGCRASKCMAFHFWMAHGHARCQRALHTGPARRRAAHASRGTNRRGKVSSGAQAGSLPETAEDAYLCRLITKGDACCVDPLSRALLNTIALVGMRPGWRTALISHLLSYKCGRHPYRSWASKENSNFLNAFCWVDAGLQYSTSTPSTWSVDPLLPID